FAGVVGNATAHDGEVTEYGGQLVGRTLERIGGRNAEVGIETWGQPAAVGLLPREPGRIARVRGDRILYRHPVAFTADAGTVKCSAGDQPPDRRPGREPIGTRGVGATADGDPEFSQLADRRRVDRCRLAPRRDVVGTLEHE